MVLNNELSSSSVFLVSGGGKGITARCVIELAKRHHCKFILLGRSQINQPEPAWAKGTLAEIDLKRRALEALRADAKTQGKKITPTQVDRVVRMILSKREIEQTLKAIRTTGGQAQYLSVDVTDGLALRKELASVTQQTIRVTGIIHGAGVLADKPIEKKTQTDFERVYQAKVTGLQNLLSCVPASQLQHLVLFSSVAGFYGNVGQADYAIANEILNKMAYQVRRDNPTCHVISINWGPWDGGMVTPALKEAFSQQNIEVIPLDIGSTMFVDELEITHNGRPQVVIGSPISAVNRNENRSAERHAHRIQRQLTLSANPFLHDHVIGGNPVLPAACAAAWMVNLAEQLYPGYCFCRFSTYKVLKGIVFDGSEPEHCLLDLQELETSSPNEREFTAKIWSKTDQGKPRYHYSGQVTLCNHQADIPQYDGFYQDNRQAMAGSTLYQDCVLFHGPAFQGIQHVLNISPERLTIEACLPQVSLETQGQFPVQTINPYILDVQLQGMLVWVNHFQQKGCLPSSTQSHTQYRPIPFNHSFFVSFEIRNRHKTTLLADVFTHDATGELYTHTIGLEVTISERLKAMFGK